MITENEYRILRPILNTKALNERYGKMLTECEKQGIRYRYMMFTYSNNWRRRHGLPMRRKVR